MAKGKRTKYLNDPELFDSLARVELPQLQIDRLGLSFGSRALQLEVEVHDGLRLTREGVGLGELIDVLFTKCVQIAEGTKWIGRVVSHKP